MPADTTIPATRLSDGFAETFGQQVVELARGVVAQYEHLLKKQQEDLQREVSAMRDENARLRVQLEESSAHEESSLSADGFKKSHSPDVIGFETIGGIQEQYMPPVPSGDQAMFDTVAMTPRTPASVYMEDAKGDDGVNGMFEQLDIEEKGYVNAYQLASYAGWTAAKDGNYELHVENTAKAIVALNLALPHLSPPTAPEELSLPGLRWIMHRTDEMDAVLNEEHARALAELRDRFVTQLTAATIARKTMVRTQDLKNAMQAEKRAFLEPVSAFVILLNAVCIGASLDVERTWFGWQIFEMFFTAFFVVELAIKVRWSGFWGMYFGEDWQWNTFDSIIVAIAVMDIAFFIMEKANLAVEVDLTKVTVIRLVRLMRITRIVRLLKFHVFKELRMMVNGVIGGLRTLFWALMLISMLVYIFGVMMRQLLLQPLACDECTTREVKAIEHIQGYADELFGSVFRSMFTVFRCFTDGCSSVDGTPLILSFWDAYGAIFVLLYTLFTIFMLFGVFNLIQAIFVEKTLEFAKADSAKRQAARYREDVRVAKELQDVVLKICAYHQSPGAVSGGRKFQKHKSSLFGIFQARARKSTDSLEVHVDHPARSMSIGREDFDQVMEDPQIRLILEDLEVAVTSSSKLFDILDSNNNGSLDVNELAEGLMKLRGPADKGDVISATLTTRALQATLKDMQQEQDKFNKTLLRVLDDIHRSQTCGEGEQRPLLGTSERRDDHLSI